MINLQEDVSQRGSWRYHRDLLPIGEEFRLSLGEGATPTTQIDGIFFKREDLNPNGSLKDRGMAFQISSAYGSGEKNLVISSSGNAAISASAYCRLVDINLTVFVAESINPKKLAMIKNSKAEVKIGKRPVSEAIKWAKRNNFPNLRPSTDPAGSIGYQTIAYELYRELGQIEELFLPVSSGTALKGIAAGFKKLGFLPRIYACQSTRTFSLAKYFDSDFVVSKTSLAEALVAKIVLDGDQILKIIRESGGGGWVISNEEIVKAGDWLEKKGILTSAEGALALAAIWKAKAKKQKLGKTVCLLTGRRY